MRFTDIRGAISIAVFPVLTVPLLLVMGLTNIGGASFLVMYFFLTMLIVGTHFGLHSIAGIFIPAAFVPMALAGPRRLLRSGRWPDP